MNDRIVKKLNKKAANILVNLCDFKLDDFSDDLQELYFISSSEDGTEETMYEPYNYMYSAVLDEYYTNDSFLKTRLNPSQVFKGYIKIFK